MQRLLLKLSALPEEEAQARFFVELIYSIRNLFVNYGQKCPPARYIVRHRPEKQKPPPKNSGSRKNGQAVFNMLQ
jgi:hypothetical protein